jgi:hypothetical protein
MIIPLLAPPVALISKAGIADMAGVQRSVVSKWIVRDLGFPAPAEGDLYDPREVTDWLIRTGHGNQEPRKLREESALYTLATLAAQYRGDFIPAVTALICLRYCNDENTRLDEQPNDPWARVRALAAELDPEDELLRGEIRAIPHHATWLVGAVDDLVEAAYGCQRAFERILASRAKFGKTGPAVAAATSPLLTRLIVELSGARELAQHKSEILVADPGARDGGLLVAVADALGEDVVPAFIGAEASPWLARLARRRLAVRGVERETGDVLIQASLPEDAQPPDVLVTQLPYQPVEDRDPYAVLDELGDMGVRLRDRRFGVVLGPADILADDLPPGPAQERAKLLKDDMVEAIIRLPVGLVPYLPRYRTALWVVTQARSSHWKGHVLTIDVSDRELSHSLVDAIADEVVTWRREGYKPDAHGRSLALDRQVAELVDPPRPLIGGDTSSGGGERKTTANDRLTQVTSWGVDLDQMAGDAAKARRPIPTGHLIATDRHPPTESIGRLASAGRLILRSGTRVNPRHLTTTGTHAVLGPADIQSPIPNGSIRRFDRATFVSTHPRSRLTEPGDVLVTLRPEAAATVDHAGFSVVEFPVRIVRIPKSERQHFAPRVLAALLFGDGKVAAGQPLEDYRIPLLPDDEVARLDQLLAEIEARRTLALHELSLLNDLRQVALRGLIDGTLSLANEE